LCGCGLREVWVPGERERGEAVRCVAAAEAAAVRAVAEMDVEAGVWEEGCGGVVEAEEVAFVVMDRGLVDVASEGVVETWAVAVRLVGDVPGEDELGAEEAL
jgi:hypothetical protein